MKRVILGVLTGVILAGWSISGAQPGIPTDVEIDSMVGHSIRLQLDMVDADIGSILEQIPAEAWDKLDSQAVRKLVLEVISAQTSSPMPPMPSMSHPMESDKLIIPIIAILCAFGAPVLIVFFVLMARRRSSQQRHQEHMALINQGVIVDPTTLLEKPKVRPPGTQRMTVWGIVFAFAGVGLTIMVAMEDGFSESGFGVVVAMIGAAMVVGAQYVKRESEKRGAVVVQDDSESPDSII
jgi:hypothetical protein